MAHIHSLYLFVLKKEKIQVSTVETAEYLIICFGYCVQIDIWRCQSPDYLSKSLVCLSNKTFLIRLMKEQQAYNVEDDRDSISV